MQSVRIKDIFSWFFPLIVLKIDNDFKIETHRKLSYFSVNIIITHLVSGSSKINNPKI